MAGARNRGLWRVATIYTVALWLAGFVWAKVDLAASGRFYGLIGLAGDVPGVVVTLALALMLQAAIIVAHEARVVGRTDGRRPLMLVLALVVAASLASGGADMVAHSSVADRWLPAMRGWAPFSRAEWLRVSFVYGWMYSLNVALTVLAITTYEARRRADELVLAREAAQVAHLTMLRYQLNPHFLFNSLNAISSLVLTRQNDAAERMIDRLATFLRANAASDPGGFVTLADELSTMQDYLDVEAVRFGERLHVDFRIAAGTGDVLVPSFLLQPLIENAIKYAIAPRQGDGVIRVEAAEAAGRLALTVADDGSVAVPPAGGTGIGLANVCARLRAFYGSAATCDARRGGDGFVVAIELPAWRRDARVQPADKAEAGAAPAPRHTSERLVASTTSSPAIPSFR